MKLVWLSTAAILIAAPPSLAVDATIIETPRQVQWSDGPPSLPKGVKLAVLSGDPSKQGEVFIVRASLPRGAEIKPHTHPTAESVTVTSGAFYVGMGEKFDPELAKKVETGGFISMPAEHAHFGFVNDDTIIELSGLGPFAIKYLNPEDDPSKQ
jgi:quercetin dioxygenase-like cupin family protein